MKNAVSLYCNLRQPTLCIPWSHQNWQIPLYRYSYPWTCNIKWGFQEEVDRKRNWEVQTCWITRVNSENCLKGVDPDQRAHMLLSHIAYLFLALIYNSIKYVTSLTSIIDVLKTIRIKFFKGNKDISKVVTSRSNMVSMPWKFLE